jgi:hypothetical protein
MLWIIIGLITIMIFFILWGLNIPFLVHRNMIIDEHISWNYVSFKKFYEEFQKVSWTINIDFPTSRFPENFFLMRKKFYYHASIIIIDGKGMVIYPWSYWRIILFNRKLKKEALNSMRNKDV